MSNVISGTCRRVQVLPRLTGVKGVRSVELIFISYTIIKEEEEFNLKDILKKHKTYRK